MSINEKKNEKINFDYIFKIVLLPLTVLLSALYAINEYFSKTGNFSLTAIIILAFLNIVLAYITQRRLNKHNSWSFIIVMLFGATMLLEGGLVCINSINANNYILTITSILSVLLGSIVSIYYYKKASLFSDDSDNNDHNGESILV